MKGFSLRTLLLSITGFAVICGLFVSRGMDVTVAHLLLVLAFAVPGGSYGYDRQRSSRSVAAGTCAGAIVGTVIVSLLLMLLDFLVLF